MKNIGLKIGKDTPLQKLKYPPLNQRLPINPCAPVILLSFRQYVGKNYLVGLLIQLSEAGMRTDMIIPSLNAGRAKEKLQHVLANHSNSPHHY